MEAAAAKAERIATLTEREVGFLKALNVRSPFTLYCSVSLPSGTLIHLSRIGELHKRRSLAGPGHIDQAKEQHISRISKAW
jgi:hypothetical protein